MDILLWIVFGLVVGVVAKLIMPGHDPGGIIVTIVLGIVGAMLGGRPCAAEAWRSRLPRPAPIISIQPFTMPQRDV